jgi:hypothetical protein
MDSRGDQRIERAEKNELAFKAHNERRAQMDERAGVPKDEPVPFACECDDPSCTETIELTIDEYQRTAAQPDQFIIAHGHQDGHVEVVVEDHPDYVVVSKPSLSRDGQRAGI